MSVGTEPHEELGVPGPAADTGKRISGWLKSKAATLEEHVEKMRENTKLIADSVQKGMAKAQRPGEERFDVVFTARALGLELDLHDGAVVRLIKPGGQAESLQVCVHDRLVAIAGEPLPAAEDAAEFVDAMKQCMSRMQRPVTLTFARAAAPASTPTAPAAGAQASEPQSSPADDGEPPIGAGAVRQRAPKLPRPVGLPFGRSEESTGSGQAELLTTRESLQRCEAELATARAETATAKQDAKAANGDAISAVEEAAALRADLADLQLSKVWNAQEAQRSLAEAESAKTEAAEASAKASRLADEVEQLRGKHAVAEQAWCAEVEEVRRLHAEEARLQQCNTEAGASVAELTEVRRDVLEELAQVRHQLSLEHEACRAEKEQAESGSASMEVRIQRLEELRVATMQEVQELEARNSAIGEQMSEVNCEADSLREGLRRREAGTVASDRLISELRREVERLHAEVQRCEARALGGGGTGAVEDRAPGGEAPLPLGAVEHEARAAAALEEAAELRAELERCARGAPPAEPAVPCGAPEASWGAAEEATAAPCAGGALEVQLRELQAENAELARRLSARPIVFQFGPMPGDDAEPGSEEDDAAAGAAAAAAAAGEAPGPRWGLLAFGALLYCRRYAARGASQCRKRRLTQSLERSLRSFTRTLLQRPLLLWLFYAHVLALWVIEFWRQAVSQPLETDVSSHLDKMVAKAAKAKSPT